MKRNELLKKTGICFTALLLAGAVAASGPSLAVNAANSSDPNLIADPSLGYTFDEIAEDVPAGDQISDDSQNGNSDGETTSTADENNTPPTDGSGTDGNEGDDNSGTGSGSGGGSEDSSENSTGDTSGSDSSSGSGTGDDTGSDSSSGSGSGTEAGTGSGDSSETDDTEAGNGSGQNSGKDSGSGKTGSGQNSGNNTGDGNSGSGQNTGKTENGNSSSGQNSGQNSGQSSGQDSSGTDSDIESGSETDDYSDSDSSGQSGQEYTRRPFIGDPNNIPYAPGIPSPTLILPETDPFAGISAPLMDIDPTMPFTVPANVLVPRPGMPEVPQYTAASLPNLETILGAGEYPAGYAQAAGYTGTNDQLIAAQNIVSGLSLMSDGFRFYTVDKDLAVSPVAQSVYEEMNNTSREVGLLSGNDALYVLNEEDNGWLYVESGNVRGFVPAAYVLRGSEAEQAVSALQNPGTDSSLQTDSVTDGDLNLNFAVETIPAGENSAFTYMRCTTKSTVIDKQYAVADQDLPILEEATSSAREIGRLSTGGICYIIQQVDDHWLYVESGNVRGFAPASSLTTGNAAKKIVQQNGEGAMSTAVQLVLPSDNAALYYSLNSTQEGTALNSIRSDIVQTAASCIGCPYKWGGNSLRGGCDCSGFVKQLYALYGYNLPRVADDQSTFGTQIPIADAAPGDLIFFASNGYVYHVALYAGNGTTIEAFSENRGIIATSIGNRDAVWATRIIQD